MDMAAGIEHLNRGTARAVEKLIIVVEPGQASLETARRIVRLAHDLGISNIFIVGNKIHNPSEKEFIENALAGYNILGFLPYDEALISCELEGKPKIVTNSKITLAVKDILDKIMGQKVSAA
jgi:CO dehydrogenase maturation factor